MVFRKPGQILKVARLSLFKLFHPTGGILCSSVKEVVLGRGWAAQGQEQDGMFAISRSVCLSARVMEGPQDGLAGEGRDLGQDVVSAQPLSGAVAVVCQPETASGVSLSPSTSKPEGEGTKPNRRGLVGVAGVKPQLAVGPALE